jgi:hypothetical protein
MYAVYRQAHSPTAIEFSVYCNFISNVERNLVVAGTSQLYVYRIIHDVEVKEPLAMFIFHFSITDLKSTMTKIVTTCRGHIFILEIQFMFTFSSSYFRMPQRQTNHQVCPKLPCTPTTF